MMTDTSPQMEFAQLIRSQRVAAIGTLRDGAPLVSMVPIVVSDDFSSYVIHISRLALHTQDILENPLVGLMISEPDNGSKDPQALARVSIQGKAVIVPRDSEEYDRLADLYLQRFPDSAMTFSLGDFELYRIDAKSARFVAGFGKIYNFGPLDFQEAANSPLE